MTTPNDYGAAMLEISGCTCKAQTVIRLWDEQGTFTVEHTHAKDCAKEVNKADWHARSSGGAPPDTTTRDERRQRRVDSVALKAKKSAAGGLA